MFPSPIRGSKTGLLFHPSSPSLRGFRPLFVGQKHIIARILLLPMTSFRPLFVGQKQRRLEWEWAQWDSFRPLFVGQKQF